MPSEGSCQPEDLSLRVGSGGIVETIFISKPVGQGPLARNVAADVKAIQEALNQVTVKGAAGGPMPFLKVDGLMGPKTQTAINNFQRIQLKIFDGVIEPNKNTLKRLNEIVAPVSDEDLKRKVALALPVAVQSIAAAITNLSAIISSGPTPVGPAAVAADRLNRHFLLDTLKPLEQSEARVALFRSYTRFAAVLSDPFLVNIDPDDEFDLDRRLQKIALVRKGGFFQPNTIDTATGRRLDRIHLGVGFFAARVTPEFGAFVMVHEVSHFVGHADGLEIEDHGRGWFNEEFIKPLSARKRLTNADSYATFAHECRVQSAAKPGFVQSSPGGLGGAR